MIVVDVLLACNLVLFVVCAVRAPRPARPSIDDLVAAARRGDDVFPAAPTHVEPVPAGSNIVPFRSREQLHQLRLAHARQLHPSSSGHH